MRSVPNFECPIGYKACNEEWLASVSDREYVTCIPQWKNIDLDCPITSFALTLEGMASETAALYSLVPRHLDSNSTLYASKKVVGHPIYDITVSLGTPCWNKEERSFSYQEGKNAMSRFDKLCSKQNVNYLPLREPSG